MSGLRSAVGRSASYRTELRLLSRCLTHERSETKIQTPDFRTNGRRLRTIASAASVALMQVFRGHARAGAYHNERSTACLR